MVYFYLLIIMTCSKSNQTLQSNLILFPLLNTCVVIIIIHLFMFEKFCIKGVSLISYNRVMLPVEQECFSSTILLLCWIWKIMSMGRSYSSYALSHRCFTIALRYTVVFCENFGENWPRYNSTVILMENWPRYNSTGPGFDSTAPAYSTWASNLISQSPQVPWC